VHEVYHHALVSGQYNLFQIYLEGIQYKQVKQFTQDCYYDTMTMFYMLSTKSRQFCRVIFVTLGNAISDEYYLSKTALAVIYWLVYHV